MCIRDRIRALPVPFASPPAPGGGGGGSFDTTPPSITPIDPSSGATISSTQLFSATVTDAGSGVKSVSFVVKADPNGTPQTFSAGYAGSDVWSTTLTGFTSGNWSWQVVAKDNAKKGGNTATSDWVPFTCCSDSGGGGGGGGSTVTNAHWTGGGAIQTAAGR